MVKNKHTVILLTDIRIIKGFTITVNDEKIIKIMMICFFLQLENKICGQWYLCSATVLYNVALLHILPHQKNRSFCDLAIIFLINCAALVVAKTGSNNDALKTVNTQLGVQNMLKNNLK